MKYTVDYFITKFKAIPTHKWGIHLYSHNGRKCALGHCGEYTLKATEESDALSILFIKRLNKTVHEVNDNTHNFYREKHPRTRILNALKEIKRITNNETP